MPARRYEWPCPGDLLHMDTARYARFERPGHRVTGDRSQRSRQWMDQRKRSATTSRTRSSMTTRGWPTSSCTPTSVLGPSQGSSTSALQWFADARHHHQAADDRQRLELHPQPLAARAARRPRHQAPTHQALPARRPTGRSSASTRRWPESGPTASATAHTTTATKPCHTGSSTTTRADHTQGSATGHPSAAFTTSVGRTASATSPTTQASPTNAVFSSRLVTEIVLLPEDDRWERL